MRDLNPTLLTNPNESSFKINQRGHITQLGSNMVRDKLLVTAIQDSYIVIHSVNKSISNKVNRSS